MNEHPLLTTLDSLDSSTDALGIRLRTQILRQLRDEEDRSA